MLYDLSAIVIADDGSYRSVAAVNQTKEAAMHKLLLRIGEMDENSNKKIVNIHVTWTEVEGE